MSLYDRDYNKQQDVNIASSYSDTALVSFVKTTYKFLAASLFIALIGVLVGWQDIAMVYQYKWALFIGELVLIFALGFVQDKPGVNVVVFALFSFISGMTLVPLLAMVMMKDPAIIAQALAMTMIIFGIMSLYALKTKRDLGNMGVALFWSVVVIFVFGLLNMFIFKSPMMQFAIASVVVIIFSLYIAYDTQNIVRGRYDNPLMAAIGLYLDILNIFTALLQILGMSSSKD
ncbi:BAX inhibitor (BI)-1/YccA family protein [Helicobacter saguini]|uniref:BAX inhibitor (BI)-1/YccA family protein n=1 Tax=Helicobacter saguini TaxID=1548018 RepID=A0A347VMZ9_9HELI|nr:Bax inhibitor-1/YccA family protein [Helicobacter saguini]MWV61958.1 BAX inhibitor (BI)-1/YccA family protein [Helicobacter saguini]MWV67367.1 BAX inhibitor (BI)-1/YccA family protein [Helicobacter saguini]MWV69720.1 BAX inhibitor (BI)-1/YccA family protein [Helicobacter saguini]MWV73063.1 BAX inhibitor (BI)-1/YccA family protein [Helicobacter saguini]TLD95563.1 Bax inhibitor-1/YccA family protein [Helicobacter saguini]